MNKGAADSSFFLFNDYNTASSKPPLISLYFPSKETKFLVFFLSGLDQ